MYLPLLRPPRKTGRELEFSASASSVPNSSICPKKTSPIEEERAYPTEMFLSVLRNPAPQRRGWLNRLIFFSLMASQSPLTYSAGGSPISPLQVVAKFFHQQQQLAKSPADLPVYITAVCRTMLFPGNLLRSVDWSSIDSIDSLSAAVEGIQVNATVVWEQAFELATKKTGWWKSMKSPEIMLAGSWSSLMGAVVTIVSGRMHFLALMGMGMFGYAMYINTMMPTLQFGLCVAIVLYGVAQRPRDYAGKEPAAAAADTGKPAPKASKEKQKAESRKKK